jgi:hypothetical protein
LLLAFIELGLPVFVSEVEQIDKPPEPRLGSKVVPR